MASLTRALTAALKAASPAPRYGATVALARRYAELLDEPAVSSRYVKPLEILASLADQAAATARNPREADQITDAMRVVALALAEHSVASDLGPKLAATLQALGMTVAAGAVQKEVTPGAGRGKRDELKERRTARQNRASATHATSS